MTLTVLRQPGHVFFRMSINQDLSDISPMIRLKFWFWERETTEISPHHFKGIYYQHALHCDVNLYQLAEVVFAMLPTIKLLPNSFQLYSQENVTMHRPLLRGGKLCSTSVRREYLHALSGILLCGRIVVSPYSVTVYFGL